jgi:hypothetical protein
MARVTYGESITEYAGSIGGVTFLRNASGPIAKLRSNPPVNPSPDQSTYQTNLAILVAFWPTLSQPNKILWHNFAAANKHTTPWGIEKTLSGYQWFLVCNLIRIIGYTPPLSSPPAWYAHAAPDPFTLVATSTYLRAEWTNTYTPHANLRIYLTLPLRQSSLKLRRSLFFVGSGVWQYPYGNLLLTSLFETLANVTWAAFYASANCSIICRVADATLSTGLQSAFTSAIVKIG